MNTHWYFVINPISGKGQGLRIWMQAQTLLEQAGISYSFDISNYHTHTIELIKNQYKQGIRHFIGFGGDGTINEIINGIYKGNSIPQTSSVIIGLLPIGTGNDWVRNRELLTLTNLVSKLTSAHTSPLEVGRVQSEKPYIDRYFANVAGAGIDGCVVKKLQSNGTPSQKGTWLYFKSLIWALFNYRTAFTKVSQNGKILFEGETFMVSAAKGKYFGGGMLLNPMVESNNELLDFTIVKREPKRILIPQLHKLYNGKIDTASFVYKLAGKTLEVETSFPIPLEADGEFLGDSAHFNFSVNKGLISVLE